MNGEKEKIIIKLKENGCRITKQRKMILDIILENRCSSCKEIYVQASKLDHSIGMATVYRLSGCSPPRRSSPLKERFSTRGRI